MAFDEEIQEFCKLAQEFENIANFDELMLDATSIGLSPAQYLLSKAILDEESIFISQREVFSNLHVLEDQGVKIDTSAYIRIGIDTVKKFGVVPIDPELSGIEVRDLDGSRELYVCWDLTNNAIDSVIALDDSKTIMLARKSLVDKLISENENLVNVVITAGRVTVNDIATSDNKLDQSMSSVQSLLKGLLQEGNQRRASDIHFDVVGTRFQIRFRIDGDLVDGPDLSLGFGALFCNVLKNLANIPESGPTSPLKGHFKTTVSDGQGALKEVNMRVNIIPVGTNYSIVIRYLDDNVPKLSTTADKKMTEIAARIRKMTKGLILVVGPTGCGKSTLMYQILEEILHDNKMIVAVEDPVEIHVSGIAQVSVNEESGIGFDAFLRSFLRHDPDVILIGETRDLEIAKQCVSNADTGHLVFTSLHTNDSISAVNRLKNMGVDAQTIAEAISMVISQRLVKKICPNCKAAYELSQSSEWRKQFKLPDGKVVLYKGAGCKDCGGTGYSGRIAVNEFLISSKKFRAMVRENRSVDEIRDALDQDGFVCMLDDGISKALSGLTTLDQMIKFAADVL